MMRALVSAVLALLALASPATVLAHGLVGRLESPLPLAVYLAGAAMAVALSFVFVIVRDVRAAAIPASVTLEVPRWLVAGIRAVGLIAWLWIIAQMIVGGSSDADVASLFLWVYGWVGVAILSAFVGPVWTWLDPFATLHDLAVAVTRRLGVRPREPAAYPAWLGRWPAVGGFAFFVWAELAYRGFDAGPIMLGYTMVTLAFMSQFGKDAWRANGETFSVWFATLNRLAPLAPAGPPGRPRLRQRPYAAGLLEPGWSLPLAVLVALGAGSILYDGLSQTEPWFRTFGLPSLPLLTLELAGFLALIVLGVLAVGRLIGWAAVGAGLVPIAVGYLVAHYLTYLLGDGQRIVIVLSDPLQLGWDLLGTAFYEPGTDWIPPGLLWTVQLAAVVGGHVLGAWSGHVVAARTARPGHDFRLRQLPLAVLMVALTTTTLWSLGQAIVQEPVTSGATTAAGVVRHERTDLD